MIREYFGNKILFGSALVLSLIFAPAVHAQFNAEEAELIDEGFRLFTKETFDGNGRTCSTCHVPKESYNIFPSTIDGLKKKEKNLLFAESVPGLENVALIESHTLFNISGGPSPLCTADDFFLCDDGHSGPVFRSTMGIFAQAITSVNARPTFPGSPLVPAFCNTGFTASLMQLGWAGDGAPGTPNTDPACKTHHGTFDPDADGTLRGFANGAIAQHSTASLDRIEGMDFRFATDDELDAMEAFQFWLGRRALTAAENAAQATVNATEFDVELLHFADGRVARGRDHYVGGPENAAGVGPPFPPPPVVDPDAGAGCNGCHINGGAMSRIGPSGFPANINLNTDVELGSDDIGLAVVGAGLPHDEGGANVFGPPFPALFEEAFNIQSVIEAAQKKAWFHNHRVVDDFEAAIEFYIHPDFIENGAGFFTSEQVMRNGNLSGSISFPYGDGVEHLGAFLRALNAFYNLRDCERLIDEAIERIEGGVSAKVPVRHCQFNLAHVKRVLKESKLPQLHKDVRLEAKKVRRKLNGSWNNPNIKKLERMKVRIRAMRDSIATQT